jgi:hypothetical protein
MADGDGGGVGTIVAAQFMAIALKLADVLDWSWFWVLVPFWGTALTMFLIITVGYTAGGIIHGIELRLRINKLHRELTEKDDRS